MAKSVCYEIDDLNLRKKYNEFTDSMGRMDRKGISKFIKCVMNIKSQFNANDKK